MITKIISRNSKRPMCPKMDRDNEHWQWKSKKKESQEDTYHFGYLMVKKKLLCFPSEDCSEPKLYVKVELFVNFSPCANHSRMTCLFWDIPCNVFEMCSVSVSQFSCSRFARNEIVQKKLWSRVRIHNTELFSSVRSPERSIARLCSHCGDFLRVCVCVCIHWVRP